MPHSRARQCSLEPATFWLIIQYLKLTYNDLKYLNILLSTGFIPLNIAVVPQLSSGVVFGASFRWYWGSVWTPESLRESFKQGWSCIWLHYIFDWSSWPCCLNSTAKERFPMINTSQNVLWFFRKHVDSQSINKDEYLVPQRIRSKRSDLHSADVTFQSL